SESGIEVALLPVAAPQRGSRPDQQRLGGVDAAPQARGHLGRSSATTVLPHRGSTYPYTCGSAWR
ncbi:MAG: hypothetical protein J2P32_05820, partial [Actinobacteria bacterium]|nr:hypothetical protein [Actinomycetota bacterium]